MARAICWAPRKSGLPTLKIGNLKTDADLMRRCPRGRDIDLRGGSMSGMARESSVFGAPNCRTTGTNFFQCQLMKNLAKFLLFVLVVSAGISLLYDYRLKHGGLRLPSGRAPEKHTLASGAKR